jgi:RNA polymerase sigma factor (sigma-70 family)
VPPFDAEALFDAHHQALYRYLVRFCGDADLAADAAQEAFARLVERPPRDGNVRAWLWRVGTNAAMEQTRTGARRRRLLAHAPMLQPIGDPPRDAHELAEGADARARVAAALAALAPKERTAVLMREEGFSHREIASAVGTTTGSVGTLLARALERLALLLPLDAEDA